jgi:hypothetical protein
MKSNVKNKKLLLIYDYYVVNGMIHYGVSGILVNYLKKNKMDYCINKHQYNEEFLNVLTKFKSLYEDLKRDEFSDLIAYNFINALNGFIIKKIFFKKFRLIFVSVDFSTKRFKNKILSNFYVFFDYLASILSDETWNCSKRIYDYRNKFLKPEKNFYIPNISNYEKKNLKKFDQFTIVMICFLQHNYVFDEIYEAFDYLKDKNIKLIIIGDGEAKEDILKKIRENNMESNIKLAGFITHDKVLDLLEKSHLGLALYSGTVDHNYWGDSLKIREYTYFELPVITTDNVYNYLEVENEKLGLVINKKGDLIAHIKSMYEDKKLYNQFLESIKIYNKKYNMDTLYDSRLKV